MNSITQITQLTYNQPRSSIIYRALWHRQT